MYRTTDPIIIDKGIQRIRHSKRVAIILFFGFIPAGILSLFLAEHFSLNFFILLAPYVLFVAIWDTYIGLTATCPRCNELYYWRMEGIGFRNFFTKRCLNCGLDLR